MTILSTIRRGWRVLVLNQQQDGAIAWLRHLHGDMASAVNPLGDLYKTQVRATLSPECPPSSWRTSQPTSGKVRR
jgi:hypothetical protein